MSEYETFEDWQADHGEWCFDTLDEYGSIQFGYESLTISDIKRLMECVERYEEVQREKYLQKSIDAGAEIA